MLIKVPDDLWKLWLENEAKYKADAPAEKWLSIEQLTVLKDRIRIGLTMLAQAEVVEVKK